MECSVLAASTEPVEDIIPFKMFVHTVLYLCDDAHNVVKHSHLRHPVLGQHGHIENTKVADNDKRALGLLLWWITR